jgi:transposase InsO family protein
MGKKGYEEKQTQSFSGVGAQHQNAEAERVIQTVMYMARSFMIHAALNWGKDGSDDLKLWTLR